MPEWLSAWIPEIHKGVDKVLKDVTHEDAGSGEEAEGKGTFVAYL